MSRWEKLWSGHDRWTIQWAERGGGRSAGAHPVLFPTCPPSEAHLQLPPNMTACSLGFCSWAGPGLGSQGRRENLPQEGGQGKGCSTSHLPQR